MITLPGGAKAYADSTGRVIVIGDKIRFRGTEYTLKEFGPNDPVIDVATLIFEEEVNVPETPHECNVDLVSS